MNRMPKLRFLIVYVAVFLALAPASVRADENANEGTAAPAASHREPYHDPNWAAIKGALLPGMVHFQFGQEERGTLFALGALVLLPVATGLVTIPLLDDDKFSKAIGIGGYITGAMVSAGESYSIVEQLNVENGYHLNDLDDLDRQARTGAGSGHVVRVTLLSGRF